MMFSSGIDLRTLKEIGVVEGLLVEIVLFLQRHERQIMTALQDATASAAAKLAALGAEITTLNAKVDALITLAQAAGVSQADIDAVTALGTTADADTAAVTAEAAKVDAANPPAAA